MPFDKTKYFKYLPKDGTQYSFKSVPVDEYNKQVYGTYFSKALPESASVSFRCLEPSTTRSYNRRHIYALKNVLNGYTNLSPHYAYSSSFGDKETQRINLISIPSIYYGSSIDKGSVKLEFYVSGTLISKIEDVNKNGELIQTTGSSGLNNVAGVVLYNEGFIILTGSWSLDDGYQQLYQTASPADNPKWIYFGAGLNHCTVNDVSSSYDLEFDGVNYINTVTMLAHAEKNDLNYSNNPTYINYDDSVSSSVIANTTTYAEDEFLSIKNTVKYAYDNYTGSLEKQVFITKIGIYDEHKNLLAVAKVSKPIRKTEDRDFTFKLKLDI